jgi:hypothetical protein
MSVIQTIQSRAQTKKKSSNRSEDPLSFMIIPSPSLSPVRQFRIHRSFLQFLRRRRRRLIRLEDASGNLLFRFTLLFVFVAILTSQEHVQTVLHCCTFCFGLPLSRRSTFHWLRRWLLDSRGCDGGLARLQDERVISRSCRSELYGTVKNKENEENVLRFSKS